MAGLHQRARESFARRFRYSLENSRESQVTDGVSDARFPGLRQKRQNAVFRASTDVGLSADWLDLSSYQHPVLRSVYAAVLKKAILRQSNRKRRRKAADDKSKEADKGKDAEKDKDKDKKDKDADKKTKLSKSLSISRHRPAHRVSADSRRELRSSRCRQIRRLFVSEVVDVPRFTEPALASIAKFDLSTRKTEPFLGGTNGFSVSANGEKFCIARDPMVHRRHRRSAETATEHSKRTIGGVPDPRAE